MKKIIVSIVVAVLVVGAVGGGIWAYRYNKDSHLVAEVMPFSYIGYIGSWYESGETTYGVVQSSMTQDIYLDSQKLLNEILVQPGDAVDVGTPILSYDATLVELELESKRLQISTMELQLQKLEKELQELNNTKPVAAAAAYVENGDKALSLTGGTPSQSVPVGSEEPQDSGAMDPATVLDENAQPLDGDGSEESPYRFLIPDTAQITGRHILDFWGYGQDGELTEALGFCRYEHYEADDPEGTLLYAWTFSGKDLESAVDPASNVNLSISVRALENGVVEIAIAQEVLPCAGTVQLNIGPYFGSGALTMVGGGESQQIVATGDTYITFQAKAGGVYRLQDSAMPEPEPLPEPEPGPIGPTKDELATLIREKEDEIRDLALEKKLQELELAKMEKRQSDCTVVSKVKGTVKSVGDPEIHDGSPLVVLAGEEGFYLAGTISELQLESVGVGQEISIQSWTSGMVYIGTITEIQDYPTSGNEYYGGNPNVSYYPFQAYIEESEGLTEWETVEVSMTGQAPGASDIMFLDKSYVREENGQKYVLVAGDDDRLEKRYIKTGRVLYGSQIEVLEGISESDRFAFPYGSTAKENVRVKDCDMNYGFR
ncbi:hypothetical protein [Bianquea renquensis]|uniref:Uncharacterized protein n=1 Tax=Bianquea renquensis TaxID=2763661 RepID=A0A926DRC6_9FIRM|nr:hypothetical protein [Bianquea renquensis]MBC8543805.1 hypothetical protein [Bianquea renquensis]